MLMILPFGNCESLETVNFRINFQIMAFQRFSKSVFENCINLTYVKLPDNLQYIGCGVFQAVINYKNHYTRKM